MQKNTFTLLLSLSVAGLLANCKKIDELLTFRIRNETNLIIPSSTVVSLNTPFNVPTPNVTTNASQSFSSNNTDVNRVKNIILEGLTLTITAPSNANFQFLKSIKIYISANGQPRKLLAFKNDIPANVGSTLVLDTTQEAMDAYVKQDQYSLETEVVTRQAVGYDTDIKAAMTFKVTASI